MAAPRFQIISDLHLETPVQTTAYSYFSLAENFPIAAEHLLLLGDIGLVTHAKLLLDFLRSLLRRSCSLEIFYIVGNHEPYHMTLRRAVSLLQSFETTLNQEFGPRFHVMFRRRIDVSPTLTLLGCTLWTHVPSEHAYEVANTLKDFNNKNGIWDRSLDEHNSDHARDVAWLNGQIMHIEQEEPHREILVLTHHSPTTDPRANSERFPPERPLNAGYRTDLSMERCWTSPSVKVWVFGHTHFSCQYIDTSNDESSGNVRRKLVASNQKGYAWPENKGNWTIEPVVIGRVDGVWNILGGDLCGKNR
ncbi:hypothetical protein E8E13_011675 [Curvularia kusanoi]|uniref:Calcineurin-like phosphoesterase domain-containing protein n=1 Tax=Curvularia kusanoi TaxID=90978 RepID=A0A9P4WF20_CURKU|nr:hypothetical protein E8E13_011675 [Curvularia kusanoi]